MRISDWSSDVCSSDPADALGADFLDERGRHLEQQARPVGDRSSIFVGAKIGVRLQELLDQIAVRTMKFDAIETGGAGIARAGPVGLDEIGDLRGFESARRLERDLAPGRVEMIAGRGNRRRCDGERASRLETRMRDAADMPKLDRKS